LRRRAAPAPRQHWPLFIRARDAAPRFHAAALSVDYVLRRAKIKPIRRVTPQRHCIALILPIHAAAARYAPRRDFDALMRYAAADYGS